MKKISGLLFFLVLFASCEDAPDYYFENKPEGRRAFSLQGAYAFSYKWNDTIELMDTLRFIRMKKNNFLITDFSEKDTLFSGEIIKRNGLYFMNRQIAGGYWDVRAFRLADDSIYNYDVLSYKADYFSEVETQKIFSDFAVSEKDGHKTYNIHNTRNETYNALYKNTNAGTRAAYKKLDDDYYATDKSDSKINQASKEELNALIYPNPAKDFLYLDFNTESDYKLKISDMSGKIILNDRFSESYRTLNVAYIPNGTYILEIFSSRQQLSQLIVIAR